MKSTQKSTQQGGKTQTHTQTDTVLSRLYSCEQSRSLRIQTDFSFCALVNAHIQIS